MFHLGMSISPGEFRAFTVASLQFHLYGGVPQFEYLGKQGSGCCEHRCGIGVTDRGDVNGSNFHPRGECPDVQIVRVDDSRQSVDLLDDRGDVDAVGSLLEEDANGVAAQVEGTCKTKRPIATPMTGSA